MSINNKLWDRQHLSKFFVFTFSHYRFFEFRQRLKALNTTFISPFETDYSHRLRNSEPCLRRKQTFRVAEPMLRSRTHIVISTFFLLLKAQSSTKPKCIKHIAYKLNVFRKLGSVSMEIKSIQEEIRIQFRMTVREGFAKLCH